ncbi:MAG TPA: acylglycerol kinase family protein, partial [Gemmatimonadaceae bacterium]
MLAGNRSGALPVAAAVRVRPLPALALLISRVLLIVNPASRRGMRGRDRVRQAFEDSGVRCDETVTSHPGHAAELAVQGDADAVFVLGGDGTVMEVVGALADTGKPVGVLPGGTGNLVARMLGVPLDL